MLKILIIAGLLFFQQEGGDPETDGPQHDTHPDWPECNQHAGQLHKCFCAKATNRCVLPGDEPTEPGAMCNHWCNKKKCGCHGHGCTS